MLINKLFLLIIFIIIFLFSPLVIEANDNILINEFLIDPLPQQVEVINIGSTSADISSWIIDDNGGSTYFTIPQSTIIYPNSCLVFSYDFNLNKSSSDIIKLISNTSTLIDSYSYSKSPGIGISFQRIPDGNETFSTNSSSLGLFNQTLTSCIITPTITPTPLNTPTPVLNSTPSLDNIISPTLTPPINYNYDQIFISEVMINPLPNENEWIELFNNNDYLVDINSWFIDDIENAGSSPKSFSIKINAKSYEVINLSSSMFNNDKDSIRLLNSNKILKDSFEYQSTKQGQSFGRISFDNDDFCLQQPSYNLSNNQCLDTISSTPVIVTLTVKPSLTTYSNKKTINYSISQSNKQFKYYSTSNSNYSTHQVLGLSNKQNNNQSLLIIINYVSFLYCLLSISGITLKALKNTRSSFL